MKKRPILKELDKVVTDVIKGIVSKNPSVFAKNAKNSVIVGDVVAKKGDNGIDIYKKGILQYEGIQNPDAAQAIVNRLISNKRVGDIPEILKLEKDYVNRKNDLLFLKNAFLNREDYEDKEIRAHRMHIITQKLQNDQKMLYRYKNI